MTWDNSKYVKLLIERPESSVGDKWLIALRSTADYYAWTETFERWIPNGSFEENGMTFFQRPSRDSQNHRGGGRGLRIGRSNSLHGNPARLTNRFTISNSIRLIDLAELAHFTKGDWHWMSTPNGERVTRDRWEAIYQKAGHYRGAGLVSA